MQEIIWKKMEDLPMDKPLFKKALILTEGRLSEKFLYVLTDYWRVDIYDKEYDFPNTHEIKKKLPSGEWAYGRFSRGIKLDKVKAWMFEEDMVKLYKEQNEQ